MSDRDAPVDRRRGSQKPGAPPRKMKTRIREGLVLIIVSTLVALGLAEIGLRLWGYRMPRLLPASIRATYRIEPHNSFVYRGYLPGTFEDFENLVELNGLGFHAKSYAAARPSVDTHRTMVLGDSYVAAFEVGLEEAFHARLEERLRDRDPLGRSDYQVIALGRGNRAQEAQLGWLREFGPVYEPDVVVLLFFSGNDIMENSAEIFAAAGDFVRFYLREVVPRKEALFEKLLWIPWSRLNGLIAEAVVTFYAQNLDLFDEAVSAEDLSSTELGLYRRPLTPEWQAAWNCTASLLDDLLRASEELGARFVVADLSGPQAVGDVGSYTLRRSDDPDMDFHRADRWIAEWGETRGVPVLHLEPYLTDAGRSQVFWRHDAHLTPAGHEVVAEVLYTFLFGDDGVVAPDSEGGQRSP